MLPFTICRNSILNRKGTIISDVIDEERNVYARPMVIRNNRTIFFLSPKGTIISFPHFFAKREKTTGGWEDPLRRRPLLPLQRENAPGDGGSGTKGG